MKEPHVEDVAHYNLLNRCTFIVGGNIRDTNLIEEFFQKRRVLLT